MILRQNFIRPRSHSNQGPHNLHSKQACRESFEKKEVVLSSSGTTTVLPACLPARGTHDRRKRREKRHDSRKELAASWQSFACARFESPTLGSLGLCTETVSSTSPVHVSRVMKFCTIAVRSGRKQHTVVAGGERQLRRRLKPPLLLSHGSRCEQSILLAAIKHRSSSIIRSW
jgi:hypothetical protein